MGPSTSRTSGEVTLALSLMAHLTFRTDLPVGLRVAIGLGRESLLPSSAQAPPLVPVDVAGLDPLVERLLECLSRESRRRGVSTWRSQEAAQLLRSWRDPADND